MSLAWYVDGLTPAQKAVLVALADHANDDGRHVYPGAKRIAIKTSYTTRTVRRALADLREMGLITVARESSHHRPTEYEIDLTECRARQARPDTESGHDLTEDPGDLTEDPERPDRGSGKPSVNHQEPSGDNHHNGVGEVYATYEQEIGRDITPFIAESIGDAVDEFGGESVCDAIRIAVENNVRKWSYVDGILKRWRANGRYSSRASPNGHQDGPEPKGFPAIDDYLAEIESRE